MNRRGFLQAALAGAVAVTPLAALAPTRTLETPLGVVSFTTDTLSHAWTLTSEPLDAEDTVRIGRRYAEALARSLVQTKETLAANILNRAFS